MKMAKMRNLNWNDLRFILAVARAESLAGAATRLEVNESTVARRLTLTEQALGTRLFERMRGVLTPTDSGQVVVEAAERVELEVHGLENTVSGLDQKAAGTVRLTAVPIIINHVLVPGLPGLIRNHPQLRLELVAEGRDLSLTKREADIALRLARPSRELRAVARRIGQLDYAVYGLPAERGHAIPWVSYEDGMRDLPQARWMADHARPGDQTTAGVLVNDAQTLLECVKAGIGKSLLPVVIGDRVPELARLDDGPPPLSREIWLMVHPELRRLTRISAVVDWLLALAAPLERHRR